MARTVQICNNDGRPWHREAPFLRTPCGRPPLRVALLFVGVAALSGSRQVFPRAEHG